MRGRSLDHYFHLLGIDPSASPEELKRAHRDLAQVWHPDRFTANPRLQKMAQEKLREINEAYTVLRCGKPPAAASPEVRLPSSPTAWLSMGAQAIGVAAAVFALIMFASGFHYWLTAPSAAEEVVVLRKAPQPEDPNERPALRRGHESKVDAGQTRISNGTEIVPPRGRRGVGTLTISNQTERDAVAALLDGNSPDAVLRM